MSESIICYVPGTVLDEPKGDIRSGTYIAVFQIHPDGAADNVRRWVRTRGDLATWVTGSGVISSGTRIVAVGEPFASTKQTEKDLGTLWLIDANQIAVDSESLS